MVATAFDVDQVSNDAAEGLGFQRPYTVRFEVVGVAPILFNRWSVEAVAEKAAAPKGSASKKTDNVESKVWRTAEGELAIPGEYFRQSIIGAARFRQDPRSPRKSAMDLFKAGVVSLDDLCLLGSKTWDFLDQRRVTVQRAGITRTRPAMLAGWKCSFSAQVLVPEYISHAMLNETFQQAGRLVGVGDFRPSYGRFQVVNFQVD